jgi:hypothetical protein
MKVFILAAKVTEAVLDTVLIASCSRHSRESSGLFLDRWIAPFTESRKLGMVTAMSAPENHAVVFQIKGFVSRVGSVYSRRQRILAVGVGPFLT